MVPVSSCGAARPCAHDELTPIRKAGQKAARLSSRFLCPRPPLRSSTKEMGLLKYKARKPFGTAGVTEGLQPISSEPAPSHRPWASVPGATPKRTGREYSVRRPTRTRTATEVSAPDAEASVSSKPATRSLPKEDLDIPRRPVDRRCGADPATAILDVPAWGATPRRSVSDYDKEEKPGAFGYFLT
jgi:hypothetical protein